MDGNCSSDTDDGPTAKKRKQERSRKAGNDQERSKKENSGRKGSRPAFVPRRPTSILKEECQTPESSGKPHSGGNFPLIMSPFY